MGYVHADTTKTKLQHLGAADVTLLHCNGLGLGDADVRMDA